MHWKAGLESKSKVITEILIISRISIFSSHTLKKFNSSKSLLSPTLDRTPLPSILPTQNRAHTSIINITFPPGNLTLNYCLELVTYF